MQGILILFLTLSLSAPAFGGPIYKWTDEKGVAHYSDAPTTKKNWEKVRVPSSTQNPPPKPKPGKRSKIKRQSSGRSNNQWADKNKLFRSASSFDSLRAAQQPLS